MQEKNEVKLLIDKPEDVLVDCHQGKLKSNGAIRPLKAQQGVACTIASRDRLRTFFGKEADKSQDFSVKNKREVELIIKKLRKVLISPPLDYSLLLDKSHKVIDRLAYELLTEICKNAYFIELKNKYNETHKVSLSARRFYHSLSLEVKGKIAFFTVLDIIDSLLGFKNIHWKIQDGFKGLQAALRENGQIIFQGKYGQWFHMEGALPYKEQNTKNRDVYFFKKNSFSPVAFRSSWTHCIIVDQAKLIDGKPYVFFKDPYDPSVPGLPDKVYMLSYDSFVERIYGKYGSRGKAEESYGTALEHSLKFS